MRTLNLTNCISYTLAVSGLFISKEHPSGVTPTEINIFSHLWYVMNYYNEKKITPRVKINTCNLLNMKSQVLINYIGRLKKKKLLNPDTSLNLLFSKPGIKINLNLTSDGKENNM